MTCPACLQPPTVCACDRYCAECACWTNHTTAWHQAAAAFDVEHLQEGGD